MARGDREGKQAERQRAITLHRERAVVGSLRTVAQSILTTCADLLLDGCSPSLQGSWPTGYSPAPWWLALWRDVALQLLHEFSMAGREAMIQEVVDVLRALALAEAGFSVTVHDRLMQGVMDRVLVGPHGVLGG